MSEMSRSRREINSATCIETIMTRGRNRARSQSESCAVGECHQRPFLPRLAASWRKTFSFLVSFLGSALGFWFFFLASIEAMLKWVRVPLP